MEIFTPTSTAYAQANKRKNGFFMYNKIYKLLNAGDFSRMRLN